MNPFLLLSSPSTLGICVPSAPLAVAVLQLSASVVVTLPSIPDFGRSQIHK